MKRYGYCIKNTYDNRFMVCWIEGCVSGKACGTQLYKTYEEAYKVALCYANQNKEKVIDKTTHH